MSEAAATAAHVAAIANAIKASGAIVTVSQEDFETILRKIEKPLVIAATGGFISTNYQYLTSYKGFVFFVKCPAPLMFSSKVEIIVAEKIWLPG
jgi:hypothetical protein